MCPLNPEEERPVSDSGLSNPKTASKLGKHRHSLWGRGARSFLQVENLGCKLFISSTWITGKQWRKVVLEVAQDRDKEIPTKGCYLSHGDSQNADWVLGDHGRGCFHSQENHRSMIQEKDGRQGYQRTQTQQRCWETSKNGPFFSSPSTS